MSATSGSTPGPLHAGQRVDPVTGARAVPIYQTAAYVFEDTEHAADLFDLNRFGNIYTRIMNPTTAVFEERMASLEGGVGALATASGLAAQAIAMHDAAGGGRRHRGVARTSTAAPTTSSRSPCARFGIDARRSSTRTTWTPWREAIDDRTRAALRRDDRQPAHRRARHRRLVAQIAGEAGVPLLIDNTFATPYLCRPIEHGAHIVVALGDEVHRRPRHHDRRRDRRQRDVPVERRALPGPGRSRAAGYRGMRFHETFGNFAFMMKARVETMRDLGPVLSPFNAFLLLQGLETLSLRMDRHVANAVALAEFLRGHPGVEWVSYPGLPDSP